MNNNKEKNVIAFCPDCLTYGTPFSLEDKRCGNCGKENLRLYVEYSELQRRENETIRRCAEIVKVKEQAVLEQLKKDHHNPLWNLRQSGKLEACSDISSTLLSQVKE